jgi:hypothetical protein
MHAGTPLTCSTRREGAPPAYGASNPAATYLQSLTVFARLGHPLVTRSRRFALDSFGVNLQQPAMVYCKTPTIENYFDPTKFGEAWPIAPMDLLVLPTGEEYTIHAVNSRIDGVTVLLVEVPLS